MPPSHFSESKLEYLSPAFQVLGHEGGVDLYRQVRFANGPRSLVLEPKWLWEVEVWEVEV